MHKIIFRTLALILLGITLYSEYQFKEYKNIILYLGFIFTLLSFGEYRLNDLFQHVKFEKISDLKINSTWLGKAFEFISFILYGLYFLIHTNMLNFK